MIVAVVTENDIFDSALCALIARFGFSAVAVSPSSAGSTEAVASVPSSPSVTYGAVVVRTAHAKKRVQSDPAFDDAAVIGLGIAAANDRGIDIPNGARATSELAGFLSELATGRGSYENVRLTGRERQILTTYALGATMSETAAAHNIAESTVREHYRRVTNRYEDAGRPVGNKAQLLIRLMADGWVNPREILHAAC